MNKKNIANYIDHTLLKSEATLSDIHNLCKEAMKYHFHSICINPYWVQDAAIHLKDSNVNICSVVGFPLGANKSSIKLNEIEACLLDGADEIDMVMNIGEFKNKNYAKIANELKKARELTQNNIIKIIIETSLLSEKEIAIASQIVESSGGDFIKTSTGFGKYGANTKNIFIILKSIHSKIQIKASGGIKSLKQLNTMLNAGAQRIGTSSSVIIMKEIHSN